MKTIPNESIDMIVTSPPYNVGVNYGNYNDNLGYEDYLNWINKVWDECFRLLKHGGRICINVGDTGRNPYYPVHCDFVSKMRKKWFMMGIIIWNKQNCLSNTAWGSWMRPSAPSLRGLHEFIIVAGKGDKFFRKSGKANEWTKREFLDATLEIWNFSPETKLADHPAPFPEELPKRCIKLYSYIDDIILDPFIGSGTTALVALKLQRRFIGIELNEEYAKLARKRVEPWLNQIRL